MDALTAIKTRASAIRLTAPGPTAEQLDEILRAAVSAPDHGRCAPWRFIIVEGEGRARLGRAMAEGLRHRAPGAPAETLEREAAKPQRAPTIIVAAAQITEGRIPEIEQVLAVGAAVQNMLLAAHALGLAAVWKTGEAAYDPLVKAALDLDSEDHIVAFVYIGAQDKRPPPRSPTLEGVARRL
jgi:nitroreductase